MVSSNLNQAVKILKKKQNKSSENMFFSLECQGILSKIVVESVKKANIITWSNALTIMPEPVYNFARKAMQQQLPTAANLTDGRKHLTRPVNCATVVNRRQTNMSFPTAVRLQH